MLRTPTSLLTRPLAWGGVLLVAVIAGGIVAILAAARYGERLQRADLTEVALTAAAAVDPALVEQLTASPVDIGGKPFEQVRAALKRVHDVNRGARFVYLMGKRGDTLVFMADAEPPDSPDYSNPGDSYEDETAGLLRVFATGEPVVELPYHDSWGDWVTGLAPVGKDATGKPLAVLGIDIAADRWLGGVARYRAVATAVAALVAALVGTFLLWASFQARWSRRVQQLNRDLAAELAERQRAEEGLRLAAAVIENTAEGIMVTRADGTIESVNPAFERITGFPAAEAVGHDPRLLRSGEHDAGFFAEMRRALEETGKWQGEIWNRRRDGTLYPQETTINSLKDGQGRVLHYAAIFSDITAHKQLENRLRELSVMDGLTGIANRRQFDETLNNEWHRAMREHRPIALMMIDLDFFKRYNDHYGHLDGDRCLQQVATTLRQAVRRAGDLVARYGGEEFAAILPGADAARARLMAETVRQRIEGMHIANPESQVSRYVTTSVGVAVLVPPAGTDPATLIALADSALYRAKREGRNRVAAALPEPTAAPADAPAGG